jgi:hypothetical protein
MTMALPTSRPADVLDCGHPAAPWYSSGGVGLSGVATDTETGATMCYPCAEGVETDAMNRATVYVAYVSRAGDAFTTWPGVHLASIDRADRNQAGRRAVTPSGYLWTRYTWHATDNDGGRWYGVNSGPGLGIRIRRLRVCQWQTEYGNGRGSRYCHQRGTYAWAQNPATLWCPRHAREAREQYGLGSTALAGGHS